MNGAKVDFSRALEAFFGQGRAFLVAKGRVAFYLGLRALALPPGAKVALPGYTCMVVPAAVQHAGLKPLYVDIDPDTYNLNPALLPSAQPGGITAVLAQHTYGLPAAMESLIGWATSNGSILIEDCCHTFGTVIHGQKAGTFGVFAFMSGQWNKVFSTGLGGILLVRDRSLAVKVQTILENQAVEPGPLRNWLLKAQMAAFDRWVTPSTGGRLAELYRALNRCGLVIGSSSPQELNGAIPKTYLARMASVQMWRGLREMARLEQNLQHRACLTSFYQHELPRIGFPTLPSMNGQALPLLRYPVRVANKSQLLAKARKEGIEIGSWFEAPLHPLGTRLDDYGYRTGMCPEAELACAQVVNLPTHLRVDRVTAEQTLEFLHRYGRTPDSFRAGSAFESREPNIGTASLKPTSRGKAHPAKDGMLPA